ncbi:MAG: Rab family GTPase [Woeseia sp.]
MTVKVCIIGDFAVGKTSSIERFVNQQFSDKYLTTVGVKIDTKEIRLATLNSDVKLVIWDVAGTERFGALEFSYLRGAAGYLLVADGTRGRTVQSALRLKQQIEERYGDLPFVFMLNKVDLRDSWEVKNDSLEDLENSFPDLFLTSAKTGQEVEAAIEKLAFRIAERELTEPK